MIIDLPDTAVTCAEDSAPNAADQWLSAASNADQQLQLDAGQAVQAQGVGGTPGGAPPLATSTAVAPQPQPPVRSDAPRQMMRDKHADMIARLDSSIRGKASRVIEGVMCASEVDEVAGKPPGWSDRKWRTAKDARACTREMPGYIAIAEKVLSSYKRSEATKPPASPTLNADVRVYIRNDVSVTYQTIDLTDDT